LKATGVWIPRIEKRKIMGLFKRRKKPLRGGGMKSGNEKPVSYLNGNKDPKKAEDVIRGGSKRRHGLTNARLTTTWK